MEKIKSLVGWNSFLAACLLFVCSFSLSAQEDIPSAPNPPRLYNNLSKEFPTFLSAADAEYLEKRLVAFADSTSNQIVVVVVDDLAGYEPWDYATRLGDKWKVGQEKEDNGIVLLIKPTGGKGERKTFIATGRGLEGAIPDLTCRQIVQNEILPNFKKGNYLQGITAALDVLQSLSKGEYNSDQYAKKNRNDASWIEILVILFVITIVVLIIFKGRGGGGNGFSIGPGGIFFGSAFGGGHHRSSGSFGGGFGGFGGGSFGGGGSGGSW